MTDFKTLAGRPGRLIAASLAPGAPLTDSIEDICRAHGVRTAVIASAVGTVQELYLRNPRDNTTLPIQREYEWADQIDTVYLKRPMEILSLQGNVTIDDEDRLWAHCHGIFSEAGGQVRGGHVFRATIWTQGEIFIQELNDLWIDRERDHEVTGLPQIQLHPGEPTPQP